LGGTGFGLGDRSFILAVTLTHQMVMTLTGNAAFRLVTVPGVTQFAMPLHQAEVTSYFLYALLTATASNANLERFQMVRRCP
jgi:hypothetical protein